MANKKVLDDLIEQRDAVLHGVWIQDTPTYNGQACLVLRQPLGMTHDQFDAYVDEFGYEPTALTHFAQKKLRAILRQRGVFVTKSVFRIYRPYRTSIDQCELCDTSVEVSGHEGRYLLTDNDGSIITHWNDKHATKQEVLDVLDEAIKEVKETNELLRLKAHRRWEEIRRG